MIKFIFRNVLGFAKGYFFRLKLDFQMNFFTACSLTRFTLIKQLNNTELDKELTFRLKRHQDFWIDKLKTL